jgi:hypothetical protein
MAGTGRTKRLYVGYSDIDGVITRHIVDDPESLSRFLKERDESTVEDFSWTGLMEVVRRGEIDGYRYVISIGEMYYETLPEVR